MNNKKSYDTIFFDIGGTLVDSPDFFDYIAANIDVPDKQEAYDFIKEGFFDMFLNNNSNFLKISEKFKIVLKGLSERYKTNDISEKAPSLYNDFFLSKSYLFDGVEEVLKELKNRNKRLVVLSDVDADVLYKELKMLNIYKYFDGFIISSEVKAYKPSDKTAAEALKYISDKKTNALMVGDSDVDILIARKLNIHSVYINRTRRKLNIEADYEVACAKDLLSIV